ncbi:hypothetical protein OOK31_00720 [Streptomyces sp. NBC_00249]|uniref:hypothetical protein n=1 Tax=Streptomyces sp. NBC_00249 TaxID=2975690 RepID=UPI0022515CBC|nr:hypothetical protein [Streptomyces sp. NBC_00249]MCX5192422.1 hypothetical protein [Streptomyces sp. NBC_00249]
MNGQQEPYEEHRDGPYVHTSYSSPVTLLREWMERTDKAPLHEFLVLGFTVDLPFLEAVAVPMARNLGARVGILGDAGHGLHQAVDVRQAGRGYLHGVASCGGGAFHPKVALLLGEHACRLAVGSGNPTLSGWGANDELWTVVATEDGASHPVFADLADWLEALPGSVAMAPWWGEDLARIAGLLADRYLSAPDPAPDPSGTRLVHNLTRPLLEQLTCEGPVDELRLHAPFVDPSGETLTRLLDLFSPADVTLGLQRHWSSYDPDGLAKAFAGHPSARVRGLEENRVRHGKLIEWRVGDRWHALVGSPNLTRAALGRATGDATAHPANCELAVLASGTRPLLPDAGPSLPLGSLTLTAEGPGRRQDVPSLILLGARADEPVGLEVVLARRPDGVEVQVELSPDGSPGSWTPVATLPPGVLRKHLPVGGTEPGSAVRVSCTLPDGSYAESAVAFLYSAEHCAPRGTADTTPRLKYAYTPQELFGDPAAARRFENDLVRLQELTAESTTAHAATGAAPRALSVRHPDGWAAYLADCRRALGTDLTQLAFGTLHVDLPELPGPRAATPWRISEITVTADDGYENAYEDGGEEAPLPDPEAAAEYVLCVPPESRPYHQAWIRRLVRRLAEDAHTTPQPRFPAPVGLLVARLHLQLLATGLWDDGDYGWRGTTAELVTALAAPADPEGEPPELRRRVDAALAVLMALLSLHGDVEGADPDPLSAAAWARSRVAVGRAEASDAEDLFLPAGGQSGHVATRSDLETLAARARTVRDPRAEAVRELAELGMSASYEDGIWEVTGSFGNVQASAAKAATLLAARLPGPALVRAASRGKSCFLAWNSPDLVRLTGRIWNGYRISPPATPATRFHSESPRPTTRGTEAIRTLEQILEATDLTLHEVFVRTAP